MLMAVENCCRIELADKADDAWVYEKSRSTTVTSNGSSLGSWFRK
jgi:hypothetical protein